MWILSASVPCGLFPLGGSVSSVFFSTVVDFFHFRAVWILSTRRLIVVVIDVIIVVVIVIVIVVIVIVLVVVVDVVCMK